MLEAVLVNIVCPFGVIYVVDVIHLGVLSTVVAHGCSLWYFLIACVIFAFRSLVPSIYVNLTYTKVE